MRRKFRTKRHIKSFLIPYIVFFLLLIIFVFVFSYISKYKSNITSLLNCFSVFSVDIKESTRDLTRLVVGVDLNVPESLIDGSSVVKGSDVVFEFSHNDVSNDPLVYIYNTHQSEEYIGSEVLPTPTVLTGAFYLKDQLESLGISTIVEEANIKDILDSNGWNYTQSYRASRINLERVKSEYPSIKLFIDFHRDSVSRDLSIVNIDGKVYAKVLFVIGKEHDNYLSNLNFTNRFNDIISSHYPSLTKGILQKEGWGVNGIYNQDVGSNVILMEVGSNNNYFDEVTNTLDLIAPLIKEDLDG